MVLLGSGSTGEALHAFSKAMKLCSSKGILMQVRQDLQLLQRSEKPVIGVLHVMKQLETKIE